MITPVQPSRPRYQDLLIHEFEVRLNRNPSYSLRAYARDLGISASNLSRILNGQQDLSLRKAQPIAKVLGLSGREAQYFYALIQAHHSRSDLKRKTALDRLETQEMAGTELSLEYFQMVSDWHYFAILELTQVKGFTSTATWIAKRLGLTVETVQQSIEQLKRMELLDESKKGVWSKNYDFRATPSGIPSRAIKTHHQQILKKAETALFTGEFKKTDFSSTRFYPRQ